MRIFASFLVLSCVVLGQTYTISTFAGGGLPVNIAGPLASLGPVHAVTVDSVGNVYLATPYDCVLRLDAATGVLTLAAGNGIPGFSGDNGPATSAQLDGPAGIAVDSAGNLYIADFFNNRIRRVSNGIITTIAGNGTSGFSGDNGLATSAGLAPVNVAVDPTGNVYIADRFNFRIRKVSSGIITTIAGNGTQGFSGDNGPAVNAPLEPYALATDPAGNIYVADFANHRIRKISNGVITTVAGNGVPGFSGDNGPAISAQLNTPTGISVDSSGNNLYLIDGGNSRIRKISNGVITTVAGNGVAGFSGDNGSATSAELDLPRGAVQGVFGSVPVDSAGNLYISDVGNLRVRKVSNGVITTVAGNGTFSFSGDGGPATSALLSNPLGVARDSAGNLYVADINNLRIRKVSGGVITTVAGNGTVGFSGDNGPAINASVGPQGVAVDSVGNLYFADAGTNSIRKVSSGVITTVAGNGTAGFSGDNGPATGAQVNGPMGLTVDSAGNLYIVDTGNQRIRKVSNGVITTVAGNGTAGFSGDNGPATSAEFAFAGVGGITVDPLGNLYITDPGNYRIRKVSSGVITTVAGNGTAGFSGDNGPATGAQVNGPMGLTVDSAGNLYIVDTGNQRIRKVSNSVITTVAGNGTAGFSGDNGPATSARLNYPVGVTSDSAGNLYFADRGNNRVRVLTPTGSSCTYSVSPTSLQAPISGGNLTVNIQTDPSCSWTISNLPNWITVSGVINGQGSTSITLVVAANTGIARSATTMIAGVSVVVNQAAASGCVSSINPGGQGFLAAGGSGTITITASQGCAWTATSSIPWVTISGASSGTGNGNVIYLVGANTGAARSGTINIAGLTFTIEQTGASISGLSTAGSMAHIAAAGGWTTTFTFVNPSANSTKIRVNFFDDNGNPLTLTLNFPQTGESGLLASTIDRTLSPGAVLEIVVGGPALQQVLTGWAQLLANGPVTGFAAFRLTEGSVDSQALVPLETRNASAYLLAFDNTGGFVAGIALANTTSQSGNVGITIRDDAGATVFSSTIAVAGMAHTSFVLSNSYGFTAGKRGTVEFDPPAGMQISTLGVQANTATGGFSTIPALTK